MLSTWEAGNGRPRTDRALLLLAAACPEASWEELAALPVGRRDARLLELRESTLGPSFSSLAQCPACGEELELGFTVDDVRVPSQPAIGEALTVDAHGYQVTFRLPTSADLASLDGVDDKHAQLLRRCIESARRGAKKKAPSRLPARVREAVIQRMAEADPQADVRAALECPDCGHAWQASFDIVSFFWRELESWAHRTLHEIHALASAYGWREADVLALSGRRRRYYLDLVGA